MGLHELYRMTGEQEFIEKSERILDFIFSHHVAAPGCEWHNLLHADMTPDKAEQKSGNWKTCYHNGRMVMELLKRLT